MWGCTWSCSWSWEWMAVWEWVSGRKRKMKKLRSLTPTDCLHKRGSTLGFIITFDKPCLYPTEAGGFSGVSCLKSQSLRYKCLISFVLWHTRNDLICVGWLNFPPPISLIGTFKGRPDCVWKVPVSSWCCTKSTGICQCKTMWWGFF